MVNLIRGGIISYYDNFVLSSSANRYGRFLRLQTAAVFVSLPSMLISV